jgi:hypothetical protein
LGLFLHLFVKISTYSLLTVSPWIRFFCLQVHYMLFHFRLWNLTASVDRERQRSMILSYFSCFLCDCWVVFCFIFCYGCSCCSCCCIHRCWFHLCREGSFSVFSLKLSIHFLAFLYSFICTFIFLLFISVSVFICPVSCYFNILFSFYFWSLCASSFLGWNFNLY